ncbi:MAG: 3-mercaptopyruvate sulfurtransferase [Proteobacteria bacterium]|jgi:thiosulfate/3-mercaptopyruvate sulfurtransferase|nr:3-mercaptopyruvate sulfurtransferase [Pseudomonadota bacterium]
MTLSNNLISTEELANKLGAENVTVVDCSWYLPTQGRDARAEFDLNHIPGAGFFDIDEICDKASPLPHMLPSAELFSESVGKLGVSNNSLVVVYDGAGLFSAARVWWMFHAFGHTNVRVLNGGFPKWVAEQRPIEKMEKKVSIRPNRSFSATPVKDLLASMETVLANCESQQAIVLDARSAARFEGSEPEPRPELPSGHMPGALSLPFSQLLSDGSLKPANELRDIFQALGVNGSKPVITSCGSGVTAAAITLALAEAGYGMHRLYDGAWTEWASADNTPIVSA